MLLTKLSEIMYYEFKKEYDKGLLKKDSKFSVLRWISNRFPDKNYPYVYCELRNLLLKEGYIEKKDKFYYLIKRGNDE